MALTRVTQFASGHSFLSDENIINFYERLDSPVEMNTLNSSYQEIGCGEKLVLLNEIIKINQHCYASIKIILKISSIFTSNSPTNLNPCLLTKDDYDHRSSKFPIIYDDFSDTDLNSHISKIYNSEGDF